MVYFTEEMNKGQVYKIVDGVEKVNSSVLSEYKSKETLHETDR